MYLLGSASVCMCICLRTIHGLYGQLDSCILHSLISSVKVRVYAVGHDEGEDDALQHALWLSSHQPHNSALLTGQLMSLFKDSVHDTQLH